LETGHIFNMILISGMEWHKLIKTITTANAVTAPPNSYMTPYTSRSSDTPGGGTPYFK